MHMETTSKDFFLIASSLLMHIPLIILCLFAVGVVTARRNSGECSSAPCRKHLGVYYVTISSCESNATLNAVITYHADGTVAAIESTQDGNLSATPVKPPYSSVNGVWKCDGPNKMETNGLLFIYRAPGFPGALAESKGKVKFDGKGCVSSTLDLILYDLASTKNKDRSEWVKLAGPLQYKGEGYKLYDICDVCRS